jgi:hypothetical protein
LQQVAVTSVATVEAYHIAGEQPSHHRSDGDFAGAEEKVGVVWEKGPRIAGGFRFRKKAAQALEEILPVLGISEDLATLDSPDHDVMEHTRSVKAS